MQCGTMAGMGRKAGRQVFPSTLSPQVLSGLLQFEDESVFGEDQRISTAIELSLSREKPPPSTIEPTPRSTPTGDMRMP